MNETMTHCSACGTDHAATLETCPECGAGGEEHRCVRCEGTYSGADACPACGTLRVDASCAEHPDRAAEGQCVICGRAVCSDCSKSDSRVCLCSAHAAVPIIEGWAQVYSTTGEMDAQLVRDNLQAEGIDAQVFSQRDRSFSLDLGELSIVRVLVPVWEYATALQLIRGHMDVEGEVVFACPGCGEAYDAGQRECTGCGAALT